MPWEPPSLCYDLESLWGTSEWSLDQRVWSLKRSPSYLQRRQRSQSNLQRGCWMRGWSGGSAQWCWGLLEGVWNKKYSKVSLELRGGWSPKNAEGVWGRSWKNSKMLLEQKTGCLLTSIAQILCTVVSNNQKDWSSKCPMVEFAINSSVNTTTGYAPFKLNHGYMPQSGQHILTDTTFKGVKQFAQQAVWNLLDVKLSRSPSNCWDPIWSKIDPLPLLWLHSNHPPRLWHYANQTPKLQAPPEPSDALLLLSENSEWPLRTPTTFLSSFVFIIPF